MNISSFVDLKKLDKEKIEGKDNDHYNKIYALVSLLQYNFRFNIFKIKLRKFYLVCRYM